MKVADHQRPILEALRQEGIKAQKAYQVAVQMAGLPQEEVAPEAEEADLVAPAQEDHQAAQAPGFQPVSVKVAQSQKTKKTLFLPEDPLWGQNQGV